MPAVSTINVPRSGPHQSTSQLLCCVGKVLKISSRITLKD
ncbi:hypothetical protein (plasmid) [Streptomyces leeuwenhoekii]|uniref:Uncharacterized protein n=1 Tax=Streptomyces leeuwenhoekii TaxID=1437453 RepID=A0A0F7VML7_STRLW|nr:hypothetical protein [Streptomyces leeuwenhoekii]